MDKFKEFILTLLSMVMATVIAMLLILIFSYKYDVKKSKETEEFKNSGYIEQEYCTQYSKKWVKKLLFNDNTF